MPVVRQITVLLQFSVLAVATASAETVTVAVASNFSDTAVVLAQSFEANNEHKLRLVHGSSGRLYAQITNGAPFDLFLSADRERPRKLELEEKAVAGSRFTYAVGRLVVWSRNPALIGQDCLAALSQQGTGKIAIANPKLAPYGRAAQEFLVASEFWQRLQPDLVFGENIAQTFQFVASGNASVGLIAQSQLLRQSMPVTSCEYPVPASTHRAIEQQAVLLPRAAERTAAIEFLRYLRSDVARAIVEERGYGVPELPE